MKNYIKKTISFYDLNTEEYFSKTLNLGDIFWIKKFISYLPDDAKILDLGCGFGRDSRIFSSNKFDTYGIDLSSKMIEKAKEFSPKTKFFVMDMLKLKFDDNFFDGVWGSASLLHLNKKDADLTILEIKRVLKNNGFLYLNLKEGFGEKNIIDERYKGVEKFYSYYQEKEIREKLDKNNFEVIDLVIENKPNEAYKNTGIIYLIAKNKKN